MAIVSYTLSIPQTILVFHSGLYIRGSMYPNMKALGPKYYAQDGFWVYHHNGVLGPYQSQSTILLKSRSKRFGFELARKIMGTMP